MHRIALYCKSFKRDLERVGFLLDSIERFNTDKLPLYVSCPEKDLAGFQNRLGTGRCTLLTDEEIAGSPQLDDQYNHQQLVKMVFAADGPTANCVVIDSDSYFIREFSTDHFMYDENTPYLIAHEGKHIWEYFQIHHPDHKPRYQGRAGGIQDYVGRKGPLLMFGNTPVVWSRAVLESMRERLLAPSDMTFVDLLRIEPYEMNWYGEWAMFSETVKVVPIKPLFKCFHYHHQYRQERRLGQTEEALAFNYLGIVMQAHFVARTRFQNRRSLLQKLFGRASG